MAYVGRLGQPLLIELYLEKTAVHQRLAEGRYIGKPLARAAAMEQLAWIEGEIEKRAAKGAIPTVTASTLTLGLAFLKACNPEAGVPISPSTPPPIQAPPIGPTHIPSRDMLDAGLEGLSKIRRGGKRKRRDGEDESAPE